jgi:hypothetical protein
MLVRRAVRWVEDWASTAQACCAFTVVYHSVEWFDNSRQVAQLDR